MNGIYLHLRFVTLVLGAWAVLDSRGFAQDAKRPVARVGQVFIIGNEVTKDSVIRAQLSVYIPGKSCNIPRSVSPRESWPV